MRLFFLTLLLGSFFMGCLKPQEFPIEPYVEFQSFTPMSDSGELVVFFTDGDGDVGLSESDTTGQFSSTQKYHHNLFVEYFEKVNGQWEAGKDLLGNDIVFLYRVPVLTPSGKNKALKGKIKVTMEPTYYNPLSANSDTIKYRVMLVDRALHESNVVESIEITR